MPIPNAKETLEKLHKEKYYSVRIRKDENNPNYVTERVFVNGECIQIPVGETVDVPETIYKLLSKKGII